MPTKCINTKHGKICYEEIGEGKKVIVFFHGFLGGPQHGQMMAEEFSKNDWRVLLPYLPGHGKSFDVPPKYGFSDLVSTMIEFLKSVAGAKTVLSGHSLGGAVAWEIACKNPELVEKLVLIDPGLKTSRGTLLARGIRAVINDFIIDRLAAKEIFPAVFNFKTLDLVKDIQVSALPPETPVLLMVGKSDRVTPLTDYGSKLKSLKSLKVKIFPGGHHWYRWQKEKFLKEVESFLRG